MSEKILVAIDGSDGARKALDFAANLSARLGGDLTILHVMMHGRSAEEMERMAFAEHIIEETFPRFNPSSVHPPVGMAEYLSHPDVDRTRAVVEIGNKILADAQQDAEIAGARNVETIMTDGDYADAILDTAEDIGADLIVVGRRGLGRVRSLILGSVSNKVMQSAACSVLAVHA